MKAKQYPARHFGRCALLLKAINEAEEPTLNYLSKVTKLSDSTIKGIRKRLEDEFAVRILRQGSKRFGFYEIEDWGILDKDAVLKYEKLILKESQKAVASKAS